MNWETEGLGKSSALGTGVESTATSRIPEFLFLSLKIILFVQTGSLQTPHLEAPPAPDMGTEHRRANSLAQTLAQVVLFPWVGVGEMPWL